ncbi:endonuclease/exonuclease/phosphatase family protein [Nonomuraea deserti]|uniref:Endonuclease/exonuclease/phosphatase family protein n=1 Tax=Nonomuraea deserti TaxID=1848322 RepID=A0A4R4VCX9_9ACTN|nr:endonuclease/exonuclease/phosphatase family protein [Nonomuraea deserti]TDD01397.1 endonuclease/exonuclease/phosphatase family protein [Nonomuraea deserti]
MGDEASMRFGRVRELAREVGKAREEVEKGRRALSESPDAVPYVPVPTVPGSNAFGDTDNAAPVGSALANLAASADDLSGVLIGVLDSDETRLGKVVTAFETLDDDIADRLFADAAKGFDVYSAHVHSHGLHEYDDYVRTGQIDTLHEAMNRGPSLLGADLNAPTLDGENHKGTGSGAAIEEFQDEGYSVYSRGVNDEGEPVGTSPVGDKPIDHVISSPALPINEPPTLTDNGTSDHMGGQGADVELPNW